MAIETNYDAIVIGGGPNGLTAAAYLQKAGSKVLLIERRHETGGGLNTDEYFGFRFNLHAIYHMMAEKMPAYKDLDLHSLGLRYLWPHVVAAFPFKDGSSMIFTRDYKETAESIAKFSQADADRYLHMWEEFQPMMDEYLIPMTYELPIPALDQLSEFGETETGEKLHQISEMSIMEVIDFYGFEDPRVRMALLSFPAIWGVHLDDPIGFLYPIYLTRMLDAAFVKGGSHRLSSALFRSFVSAGGTIVDENEASKILIEDGVAVGVRIADGREFRADAVVSTLNPMQTFQQLLTEEEVPGTLSQAVDKWEWEERSKYGLHLGFSSEQGIRYKADDPRVNEAMIVFLGLETEDDLLDQLEDVVTGDVTGAEWLQVTMPSTFDKTMAPENHSLGRIESVVAYDPEWRSKSKVHGDACLDTLKQFAEVDEDNVVIRRETTPVDIEEKIKTMHRGSYKHGAYTSLQLGYLRPNDQCSRSETPIDGLFIGGASMYPGGMILGATGYLAATVVGEYLETPIETAKE